jgi:hypothetical protein
MKDTREYILASIRHGLGRSALPADARAEVDARLQGQGVASLRPQLSADEPAATFRAGLERLSGTLSELHTVNELPAAVAAYLGNENLPGTVAIAPAMQDLDWPSANLALRFGRASGDETTGVSQAFCGIVETGSLVILSGPDNPTTLNFLPDHHLVVLHRKDLVMHIEDVWTRMRTQQANWPRTVNIITGPSRTADIEQTIQIGAHGPRRLHVLLVN